jgi:hypothetical protein
MYAEDPLLGRLTDWGTRWTLSSVGIRGIPATCVEPILAHRCLSLLYADRIVEAEAVDRLADPGVRQLVHGVLGPFPDLSPKLYRLLSDTSAASCEPAPNE